MPWHTCQAWSWSDVERVTSTCLWARLQSARRWWKDSLRKGMFFIALSKKKKIPNLWKCYSHRKAQEHMHIKLTNFHCDRSSPTLKNTSKCPDCTSSLAENLSWNSDSLLVIESHSLSVEEKNKKAYHCFQLANCSFLGLSLAYHDNHSEPAYARG